MNTHDRTPLYRAVRSDDAEAVRTLLAAGANPNARDANGRAPLHEAAEWGNVEAVAALLDGGADSGARSKCGELPVDVLRSNGPPNVRYNDVYWRLNDARYR
ncbi:MAG: ankyrin repeat domain-containing protein [Rhodospirillales bacterium]|nr:ankyrin repeat domain-containing protein [Rhodospirillales bacterium]